EVYYRVSSRYLVLASPHFRRTLGQWNWGESIKNEKDGLYHIFAEDWDEEAFLIVLRAIHGLTRQVPKTTSLEMLAKIATILEYYELEQAEILEDRTTQWMQHVKDTCPIPESYCRDLMLWIYVSWAFNLTPEFEKSTATLIRHSHGWIQFQDLPLPPGIIALLKEKRRVALTKFFTELHDLPAQFRAAVYTCPFDSSQSFECGIFMFGSLTKELDTWDYTPQPEASYLGISIHKAYTKAMVGREAVWAPHSGHQTPKKKRSSFHPCNLSSRLVSARLILMSIRGLNLKEIKGHATPLRLA
ncbi:hypothetical protein BU23DRAFT_457031, partial [Bimuria novae-zelandiae CBS 107.79]